MFSIGDTVCIIFENEIRKGKLYGKDESLGYRVADGSLDGEFAFSVWVQEENIAKC